MSTFCITLSTCLRTMKHDYDRITRKVNKVSRDEWSVVCEFIVTHV